MDIVTVLAIIEQSYAVVTLGEVSEAVSADLKLGLIPRGILVSGTLGGTVLDLVGSTGGIDVHVKGSLDALMLLLPIHRGLEVDAIDILVQPNVLGEGGAHVLAHDLDTRTGAIVDELYGLHLINGGILVNGVLTPLPSVVLIGIVSIHTELVAQTTLADHLTVVPLVVDGADVHVGIELHLEELVLAGVGRGLDGICGIEVLHAGIALGGNTGYVGSNAVHLDDAVAGGGIGVEYHISLGGVNACGDPTHGRIHLLMGDGLHNGVVLIALLIDLLDGGAGDDIVELVGQHHLPALMQLGLGESGAEQAVAHAAQQLGIEVQLLATAVVLLVLGLGGIGSSVELQVELTLPYGEAGITVHLLLQTGKEVACEIDLEGGSAGDTLFQSAGDLQILLGGAAAAIAVSEGQKGLFGQLLLLEAVVRTGHHSRVGSAYVGGISRRNTTGGNVLSGQEIGVDLGAVDSFPQEGIVGHHVGIVPADLGGDEPIHTALAEDLGQGGGIAEHVGQPQDVVIYAELFLEEALPVQDLSNKALTRAEVTVSLDPHGAIAFPSAVLDVLSDLLIQLGSLLLEVLIQEGLGGHELILRVLSHQLQHGGEGTLYLLSGLLKSPEPCTVDMGVTDARYRNSGLVLGTVLAVELLIHILACHADGSEELLRGNLIQVQEIEGIAEHIDDGTVLAAVSVQIVQGLVGSEDVVPQLFHLAVQLEHLQNEAGRGGLDARIGIQNDLMLAAGREIQSGMVDIHTLYHLAVHVGNELRVIGIPTACEIRDDVDEHVTWVAGLGNDCVKLEPGMAIVAVSPGVLIGVKGNQSLVGGQFPRRLVLTGAIFDIGDPTEGICPMFVEYLQISGDLLVQSFHSRLLAPFISIV